MSTLKRLVQEQAPTLALDSVMTMDDRVMTSLAKPRLYAVVLAWFGVFALLVAGVGLFGVLSFSVAQRTREIGVRSALGAQARDIVSLVLRQTLWIVGIGVLFGLAAALSGVRLLSRFCTALARTTRSRSSPCQWSLSWSPLSRASCRRGVQRRWIRSQRSGRDNTLFQWQGLACRAHRQSPSSRHTAA